MEGWVAGLPPIRVSVGFLDFFELDETLASVSQPYFDKHLTYVSILYVVEATDRDIETQL